MKDILFNGNPPNSNEETNADEKYEDIRLIKTHMQTSQRKKNESPELNDGVVKLLEQ
ncbi:8054_t:CDS:2 [Diversispora eburnea]|uniref:8054_t:CDS:1 n=1 Tax=Diversispora eburnea TaxID=1213867 RepID=A0A9N8V453_9GLOM|nr:8054_t:CDS:2 [Diversispora eburnea]